MRGVRPQVDYTAAAVRSSGGLSTIRRPPLTLPWRRFGLTPSAPTRWQIGNFEHRRVKLHDRREARDCALRDVRVLPAQELPAVIVFVVRHVKNWRTIEQDRPERYCGAVRWLIEWPIGLRHGG
jgi:hypothetical protein